MIKLRVGMLALAPLVLALLAHPARADVIDGDWCSSDGKHFSIAGPEIVTPGGTRMKGDYTRHSFVYVIPEKEANAGQTVLMILLNEETVALRRGADRAAAAQAKEQIWRRCAPIAALPPPWAAG
jgi:hypothetical protein